MKNVPGLTNNSNFGSIGLASLLERQEHVVKIVVAPQTGWKKQLTYWNLARRRAKGGKSTCDHISTPFLLKSWLLSINCQHWWRSFRAQVFFLLICKRKSRFIRVEKRRESELTALQRLTFQQKWVAEEIDKILIRRMQRCQFLRETLYAF